VQPVHFCRQIGVFSIKFLATFLEALRHEVLRHNVREEFTLTANTPGFRHIARATPAGSEATDGSGRGEGDGLGPVHGRK
jgi:hypothetical protein